MRDALQHEFPRWEVMNDGEFRECWYGSMRIVSPRRARKLRKRGVPLMPLHAVVQQPIDPTKPELGTRPAPTTPNGRARYAWYEPDVDAANRKYKRGAQCYNMYRDACAGEVGRKVWLQERLQEQREDHAARAYFRRGAKLAATLFYQTHTGYVLPDVHAANPQLDIYAAAFRAMFGGTFEAVLEPQLADGAGLDALAKQWGMPAHWTNEQRRQYLTTGYVVEEGHGETDGRTHRMSPPLHVYVPAVLQREDETDREFVQRHLAQGNVPVYDMQAPPLSQYVLSLPAAFGDKPLEGFAASDAFEYDPAAHDERPKP